ncbi:common myeloid progenitor cell proliferation [Balamuthia mandrillaris]
MEEQGSAFVQRLPGELTLFILSFLDFGALCSASRVCREWHSLSCERALWLVSYFSSLSLSLSLSDLLFPFFLPSNLASLLLFKTKNLLAKSLTRLKNTSHESHAVQKPNKDKQKQIKGLVRTSEGQVLSGSVECLIDEAIHTHEELFAQQFLNTYPTFITRSALLLRLLRRYDASLLPLCTNETGDSDNDDEEQEEEGSVNIRLREGEQFLSAEQLREEHVQRAKKAKETEEGEEEDETFSELWRKTNICRLLAQWCSSFALEDFIKCTENDSEKANTSEEEDEKGTGKEREEEDAENEVVLALKIFVRGMVLRDFSSMLSNREEQTRGLEHNNNHKKKEDGKKHVKEQQQQDEQKKGKKRSKFGALFGRKTQKEKEKEKETERAEEC